MALRHEVAGGTRVTGRSQAAWAWRAATWALGIVGGIAAFLGVFILVAGEDHYIGIGGAWSWRVGDIAPAWGYGLLIGGAVLLLITLYLAMSGVASARSVAPAGDRSVLLLHAAIFLVVNAFIWLQDVAIGGGAEYAYWVTIPWGIGLAIHGLVYFLGGRGTANAPG